MEEPETRLPKFGKFARGIEQEKLNPEEKQRIKIWMAVCLSIFALSIDLMEMGSTYVLIGALLSSIFSPAIAFTYWILYQMLGVPYMGNPKRLLVVILQFLVEIVPGFDAVPVLAFGWTIGTILTIIITRAEDSGGIIGKVANSVPTLKK